MKPIAFPALEVARKSGEEHFSVAGEDLALRLLDFWRWSASDLVNNAARGILAEWIVASALGLNESVRREWDAFDLLTKDGTKIEVKSAAYLQSWEHAKLSAIQFDIRPTRAWNAELNAHDEAMRQADIYVFCLLKHQDKTTLDPMNFDQWQFFVLSADTLNENCALQRTIGLKSLEKLKPRVVSYENLAVAIAELSASEN